MSVPSPFVYWAQDKKTIFFKVDMRDAQNVSCKSDGKTVKFSADGHGAQGNKRYEFDLDLLNHVDKTPYIRTTGSQVDIAFIKKEYEFWSTLTASGKRAHWLKFDFNRWKDPEGDSEPDDSDLMSNEDKLKEWARKYGKNASNSDDSNPVDAFVTTFYIFAYNIVLFLIHFYILACLAHGYMTKRNLYFGSFWNSIHLGIYAATCLQYGDVIHGFLGLTKCGWKTGIIQVSGRLFIVLLIDSVPELHTSVTTFCLMFVYFLIEQFRYPYYALATLGLDLYPITWLRYSIWIILYPSGLFLEAITMLNAIPYFYYSGKWSISLPNYLNMSFNFGVFLAIFVATGFPKICFTLISHMRKQRAKKLGYDEKKKC